MKRIANKSLFIPRTFFNRTFCFLFLLILFAPACKDMALGGFKLLTQNKGTSGQYVWASFWRSMNDPWAYPPEIPVGTPIYVDTVSQWECDPGWTTLIMSWNGTGTTTMTEGILEIKSGGNILAAAPWSGAFESNDMYGWAYFCLDFDCSNFSITNAPDCIRPQGDEAARGDPFNAISGNMLRDETDIAIPAPGLSLAFGRSYNSMDTNGASFGLGWRASTDWVLSKPSATTVQIMTGEGRTISLDGSGTNFACKMDVRWRVRGETNGNWILDGRDGGLIMRFDTNGLWSSMNDGWSNSITAVRDAQGRLTNLVHSCGASLSVEWTNNRIFAVATADGMLRADYVYNTAGLLTGVVRTAASEQTISRTYGYAPDTGLLTNTINALGQELVYQYAANGRHRCTRSAYADGTLVSAASWNTANALVDITYPVSATTSRTETVRWLTSFPQNSYYLPYVDNSPNGGTITVRLPADVTGVPDDYPPLVPRIASVELGGQTQNYYYDMLTMAPTAMVWSAGGLSAGICSGLDTEGRPITQSSSYGGQTGTVWSAQWSADLDLPVATIDPLGWRTEYTWTNGLPATIAETNGVGGWLTTSLVYSQGLLAAVSDPLNRTTCFQHDTRGCLTSVEPPVGPVVAFSNDALGKIVSMTLPGEDASTREWTFQRDGFGHVINAMAPDGIAVQASYDAIGNLTGLVDRAGRQLAITYGMDSRPLAITRTIPENGSNRVVTLAASRDLQMAPTAIIDPLDRTVESWTRDDAGRIATITNIEGRTATMQYGPADLPLSVTRFDGTVNSMTYNGDWRTTASVFPGRTNTFGWLANGLLATVANEQATVTNTWIAPGWLTSQETRIAGWTGRVDYACDLSGAITQVIASAIGLSSARQFDGGGRETNRTQTCNGVTLDSTREYGAWNGRPTHVTTGPIQQTLGWDQLDRLTNLTWQAQGQTVREIRFYYDVLGQITQRVDTVAGVEKSRAYMYDGFDRLAFEEHGSEYVAAYTFDDVGRRIYKDTVDFGVDYANGEGDRLAGWSVSRTSLTFTVNGIASQAIGTNTQFGFRQVYNSMGTASPTINGSNFTASLLAEPFGTQTVVALVSDVAGNVGVTTNRHFLTAYTTGAYSSDAAGCVTQIVYQGPYCQQAKVLSWDTEYRLTSVKTNGATAESYGLDPLGRRLSTTAANGTITRHLNDGQHVLADLDSTGGVLRTYFYGPNTDELLAMTVHTGATPRTYIALRDHQNTIWGWTDTNGVVVESYDFDAWGRVLSVNDGNGFVLSSSAIGNRYLFQGREYSWTTGLYYFRARWYDPVTGRWLSNDPIGINGGLNQYVFVGNNLVNATDPSGLSPIKIVTLIGKGFKVIGKVDKMEDAVRLFKEGEDLVASRNTMQEIAKRAGDGRPPIRDVPKKYNPHYHNATRTGGHGFYGSVAGVTAYGTIYGYVEDQNIVARGCAGFLDFFNPLAIPNDVVELIGLFRSDEEPDDNRK